jgi:N-acetyl-gamma-glutamyl-phosphate reductase
MKMIDSAFTGIYDKEPFVSLVDFAPSTKHVKGTNMTFINYTYDQASNTLVVFSAIDNLMKGAASQAIQNMNIMCGWDEKTSIDKCTSHL